MVSGVGRRRGIRCRAADPLRLQNANVPPLFHLHREQGEADELRNKLALVEAEMETQAAEIKQMARSRLLARLCL